MYTNESLAVSLQDLTSYNSNPKTEAKATSLDAMRTLAMRHREELDKYTNIDTTEMVNLKYLYEFDRVYQCATWGYPTEEAYYRDASSSDSLLAVRIPFLAINAVDDPIASNLSLPYAEASRNPYTILCTTSLGGHLGWFELGGGRWHGKPVRLLDF